MKSEIVFSFWESVPEPITRDSTLESTGCSDLRYLLSHVPSPGQTWKSE